MSVKMKRDQIDGFLNTFVTCQQSKRGTNEGLFYTAGFFQAQLASLLADLPAAKQMEVINVLVNRSLKD